MEIEGVNDTNIKPQKSASYATIEKPKSVSIVRGRGMMQQPLLGASSRQSPPYSSTLIIYLYTGHFLARWGARMWEFSVGLYMINIWPNSLLFAAIYGVVESASTALFGPIIGRWVDYFTYNQVLQTWLLTQNLSFILAGGTVSSLLICHGLKSTNFLLFAVLVILTNLSGAVAVLSSLAGTILIEREWVVVIANGEPPEFLTRMNSVIRRIDLTCKLAAPVLSGLIISFISLKASAISIALWNILSVFLQYWLLRSVYNGIPALKEGKQRQKDEFPTDNCSMSPMASEKLASVIPSQGNSSSAQNRSSSSILGNIVCLPCVDPWVVYMCQEVVLPGVALAFLFFTVLSYGTLMTAFLEWKGIPAFVIGIARGISAAVGISATFVYPVAHSHISSVRTGLWSIWIQWSFLVVSVASIWVHSGYISAWMLMGSVAASRLGLWMFDLSVMQQMQDLVPECDRCVVGGVQNSLQSALDLMTYVLGIIVSNPKDFGTLVIVSFSSVTAAAVLYTFYVYRVRKHLFHFDKIYERFFPS